MVQWAGGSIKRLPAKYAKKRERIFSDSRVPRRSFLAKPGHFVCLAGSVSSFPHCALGVENQSDGRTLWIDCASAHPVMAIGIKGRKSGSFTNLSMALRSSKKTISPLANEGGNR